MSGPKFRDRTVGPSIAKDIDLKSNATADQQRDTVTRADMTALIQSTANSVKSYADSSATSQAGNVTTNLNNEVTRAKAAEQSIRDQLGKITYFTVDRSTPISITSAADQTISGMTITPPAGTYQATFTGVFFMSGTATGKVSLYLGGTIVAASPVGNTAAANEYWTAATQAIITADGITAINVRYSSTVKSITCSTGCLILERLN